ncbi:Mrp/NBP35 family ATP-binding protein [Macrococcus equipercicus]|uniref:Iron-sulfur cluster carrier protein n=1 Tax=Macrococcus equipercicus TaxID=69967 RepID=A0ABQ6R724_9STAP|nr:Mrp/NBP35 family ATP-binding protein [Macrococcus equipercicus]KAA1037649.1 Mrp/NBP35 family ATP-binding protein [Macrococcus equipercicus]
MLTIEAATNLLGEILDPIINIPLKETGGIKEVTIKEEKEHVSVKIAMAKLGGQPQLDLQTKIVETLKANGARTVGLRFEQLEDAALEQFRAETGSEIERQLKNTEFISIASGKGGVGKSTVSVNLAVALARLGKKVGLVDADIYGFSVPDMMGITSRPGINGQMIVPVERFGVKVISMAFFVEENTPVIWRGPMLGKMINNFFREVEWGELDYILLDLPPGTGDVALDVHEMLPKSKEIVVTTPHPTAAFVAARAGAMALHTNHDILGVVENMSYFESRETGNREYVFGTGGGEKLADELNTELIGQLPLAQPDWNEYDFAPSVYAADHPLGIIYRNMAAKVIEKTEK